MPFLENYHALIKFLNMRKGHLLILYLITVTLIIGLLQSCDPAKIIIIKQRDCTLCSLTLYAKSSFLLDKGPYSNKQIIIKAPTKGSVITGKRVISYGIGIWSDSEIRQLSKTIDSIVVFTGDSKKVYWDCNEIQRYLLKNRKGFTASIIRI